MLWPALRSAGALQSIPISFSQNFLAGSGFSLCSPQTERATLPPPLFLSASRKHCFGLVFTLKFSKYKRKKQLHLFQLFILLPSGLMEIFLKSLGSFFLIYSNQPPPLPFVLSQLKCSERRCLLFCCHP